VQRLPGRPLSAWHRGTPRDATDAARRWPLVSLEPTSRAWLHARIAGRFDAMLAHGLVDEVRALRARGDLHAGLPAMRCVGYRQAWEALDGNHMLQLREKGIAATRQLAKRQLTWLRSITPKVVLPCDTGDALPHALRTLQRLCEHGAS
jgi:tRNA dimethylallyltransferase